MYGFLIILFIIACFALIVSILLQSSKGGGLAGAFGGGGGDMSAVFGGRGAGNFLSKTTGWLAVAFLGISLTLSFLNRGSTGENQSLVQQEQKKRGSVPASRLPIVPTNEQQFLPVESEQVTTDSIK